MLDYYFLSRIIVTLWRVGWWLILSVMVVAFTVWAMRNDPSLLTTATLLTTCATTAGSTLASLAR